MDWYYSNGGNRMGPVTPVVFEDLIKDNVVTGESLVWAHGMADWVPYKQVAEETAVCASSGGRYWKRDMVPYEGQFISAEHKELYFQRLREGVVQPGRMVYGDFGTRFLAKLIDGIINWVIQTVVNLGLAALFFGSFIYQPKPGAGTPATLIMFQVVSFLLNISIGVAYYWYFLKHQNGATPGKKALGLKVVRSDGSPLTTGRIIGRYFAEFLSAMILFIGYIMAGFDDERRTLHDRICDTRVIKSR